MGATSNDIPLTIRFDNGGGGGATQYIGRAYPGSDDAQPVWQIRAIFTVGNVMQVAYANGDPGFKFIWNNRAALSYPV